MARIAIVRHGRTAWNAAGRLLGRHDPGLDAVGIAQADATAEALAEQLWDGVLCSPLLRARQSADRIAARIAPDLDTGEAVEVPALIERRFGAAEGMLRTEAFERWPDGAFPGAETPADVEARVAAWWQAARPSCAGRSLIVVTHLMTARALLTVLGEHPGADLGNGECRIVRLA